MEQIYERLIYGKYGEFIYDNDAVFYKKYLA